MIIFLLFFSKLPTTLCNVFETRTILENYRRPSNLVYHKYTNTLFFSHTVNKTDLDFEIVAYDIDKNDVDTLDVPGGCAIAYDVGNDDIYFGGHDGIYKYNYILEQAEFFAEDKTSIWNMFIGANFYYIEYPTQQLFVYSNDKFVPVAEAIGKEIDNFYISKRKDIYYSNKTATFKIDAVTKETIVLNDDVKVRQMAQDNTGGMYFCGTGGIYMEYQPNYNLNKLVDLVDVFSITFDDYNNIIYSDDHGIYKLVAVKK